MTAAATSLVADGAPPRRRAPPRWPWAVFSTVLHVAVITAVLLWPDRPRREAEEALGVALVFAESETEAPVQGQAGASLAQPPATPPVPDQPPQPDPPRPEQLAALPPVPPPPPAPALQPPPQPPPPQTVREPPPPEPPRPAPPAEPPPEPAPVRAPDPPPLEAPAAPPQQAAELPPPPTQTPAERPEPRPLPRVFQPDEQPTPIWERWAALPRVIEPEMIETPPQARPEPPPPELPPPPRPRNARPSRPAARSPAAPPGPGTDGPEQPLVLGGGIATGAVVPPSIDPGVTNPPPAYPEASRRAGEQGIVGVLITVAPDGTVSAVQVTQSSGFPALDEAARRAVQRWRFRPGQRAGVPVTASIRTAVHFRLQGGR